MKKKIGIGIIGYGSMGKVHAMGYQSIPYLYHPMPADIKVLAIASKSLSSLRLAEEQTGTPIVTQDYKEILKNDDIDIIDICTPNDLHAEIAIQALELGKHVYCEKPLAKNLPEAEQIQKAASRSAGFFQIAFNYRFAPAIIRARQLITAGLLGNIISFHAAYLHSSYLGNTRKISWRLQKERSGGGALVDLGSHAADLLLYLSGQTIHRLFAQTRTIVTERSTPEGGIAKVDVDDDAWVRVELAGGGQGTVEAGRIAMGSTDDLNIIIRGDRGALAWRLMDPNWLSIYDGQTDDFPQGGQRGWQKIETIQRFPPPAVLPSSKATLGWSRLHAASQFNLIESIAKGEFSGPGIEDGMKVQTFLAAAYQSAQTGQWVTLNS